MVMCMMREDVRLKEERGLLIHGNNNRIPLLMMKMACLGSGPYR